MELGDKTLMPCAHCNDTGWMNVRYGPNNERMGVARCVCRTRAKAEQEKQAPSGFQNTGSVLKRNSELRVTSSELQSMGEPDSKIAEIILGHRGKSDPISIEAICKELWWREWAYRGEGDASAVHSRRNNLIRSVKASVERIRKEARMPIAATKAPPYGYYIPVTAEECDECYRRLFGEGVKLILLSRLFRPDADVVQELRGQLRIASSEL